MAPIYPVRSRFSRMPQVRRVATPDGAAATSSATRFVRAAAWMKGLLSVGWQRSAVARQGQAIRLNAADPAVLAAFSAISHTVAFDVVSPRAGRTEVLEGPPLRIAQEDHHVIITVPQGLTASQEIFLGRHRAPETPNCHSVVLSSPYVSGQHARVDIHPNGRVQIADTGSKNGTFQDGESVHFITGSLHHGPVRFSLSLAVQVTIAKDTVAPAAATDAETSHNFIPTRLVESEPLAARAAIAHATPSQPRQLGSLLGALAQEAGFPIDAFTIRQTSDVFSSTPTTIITLTHGATRLIVTTPSRVDSAAVARTLARVMAEQGHAFSGHAITVRIALESSADIAASACRGGAAIAGHRTGFTLATISPDGEVTYTALSIPQGVLRPDRHGVILRSVLAPGARATALRAAISLPWNLGEQDTPERQARELNTLADTLRHALRRVIETTASHFAQHGER